MSKVNTYEISRGLKQGCFTQTIKEMFEKLNFLEEEFNIFEYGCGSGIFAIDLFDAIPQTCSVNYIGIDNNKKQLEKFEEKLYNERKNVLIKLVYKDVYDYEFNSNMKFKIMVFSGFQHKAKDWFKLLKDSQKHLSNNAMIFIVYKIDNWIKKIFNLIDLECKVLEDRILDDYWQYREEYGCDYPIEQREKLRFITNPDITNKFLNDNLSTQLMCSTDCNWKQEYTIKEFIAYIEKQIHTSFEHVPAEINTKICKQLRLKYKANLEDKISFENIYQVNLYAIKSL